MKKAEKFFFLILAIVAGIGLLEGYKAFLKWIYPEWRITILLDIIFLISLLLYRIRGKVIFGIISFVVGCFLIIALLESSWNLFLIIPTFLILDLKKK